MEILMGGIKGTGGLARVDSQNGFEVCCWEASSRLGWKRDQRGKEGVNRERGYKQINASGTECRFLGEKGSVVLNRTINGRWKVKFETW